MATVHNLTTTTIPEKTTAKISFVVKDEDGTAIPGTSLATLTVTLYNLGDGAIINGRNQTNILGANGGSVDANGKGSWVMDPADNPIVSTAGPEFEDHVALFEWTYSTTKAGKAEVVIRVRNLTKVT